MLVLFLLDWSCIMDVETFILFSSQLQTFLLVKRTLRLSDFFLSFKVAGVLWKVDGCGSISSTYLDSWSNESSWRNLAENPAHFAGCWLLNTTLRLRGSTTSQSINTTNTRIARLKKPSHKVFSFIMTWVHAGTRHME